jgi:hypothetical protein
MSARPLIEDTPMGRSQAIAAYAILLSTCGSGVLHAPWWAAVAGACSLALASLITMRARVASVPELRTANEPTLVLSSLLNAAVFAAGAYVFGQVARWLWGL